MNFFPRFSLFSKSTAGVDRGRAGGAGGRKQNKHTVSGMTDLHDISTYHFPKIRKNLGKKLIPHFPYFPSKNEFFRDGKLGKQFKENFKCPVSKLTNLCFHRFSYDIITRRAFKIFLKKISKFSVTEKFIF